MTISNDFKNNAQDIETLDVCQPDAGSNEIDPATYARAAALLKEVNDAPLTRSEQRLLQTLDR